MSKPTFDLGASAYAEMIKDGFHPDFPTGTDAQVIAIAEKLRPGVHPGAGGARSARSLLVVDRQRYFAGSRPDGVGGARERGGHGSRRSGRDTQDAKTTNADAGPDAGPIRVRVAVANVAGGGGEGLTDRPACGAADQDGVYGDAEFSDAAECAFDGYDFVESG